jgi:hypothetical protein
LDVVVMMTPVLVAPLTLSPTPTHVEEPPVVQATCERLVTEAKEVADHVEPFPPQAADAEVDPFPRAMQVSPALPGHWTPASTAAAPL